MRARVVALLLVVLWSVAPAAEAHSQLERSDPPDQGQVSVGRTTLSLWFTEDVALEESTFDLHTIDGVDVSATVSAAESGGRFVELDTAALDKEVYLLAWRVISTEDGHPSVGTVVFGAGTRPPPVAGSSGQGWPETPDLVLRWLDLSALMLALGALTVSGRVLAAAGARAASARAAGAGGPRRRALQVAAVAAGLATLYGAAAPLLRAETGATVTSWVDSAWRTVVASPWGHVWALREAALLVAALSLVWAVRAVGAGTVRTGPLRPPATWVAAGALAVAVVAEAWAGHAATLAHGSTVVALATAAHLAAAGVWAGGLAVIALCLVPRATRADATYRAALVRCLRAFSPTAAVSAVVLVASGFAMAGRQLPDFGAATSTVYGEGVTAKLVLAGLALGAAGLNTLVVHPGLADTVSARVGRPRWFRVPGPGLLPGLVLAEVCVLALATGAAALVTSVPTSREIANAIRLTTPHHDEVAGLYLTLEQVPAGPGRTRFIARLSPTVLPPPAPVRQVAVILDGLGDGVGETARTSREVPLGLVEPGRFQAETDTPPPGRWTTTLVVRRPGMVDATTESEWVVAGPRRESAGPVEVLGTSVALLLLLGLASVPALRRRRDLASGPVHRERPEEPEAAEQPEATEQPERTGSVS